MINDRRRDAERRHHRTPQLDASKLRPRYLHYSKIIFLAARNPGILESWNPGILGPWGPISPVSPHPNPRGASKLTGAGIELGVHAHVVCSSLLVHARACSHTHKTCACNDTLVPRDQSVTDVTLWSVGYFFGHDGPK